MRIWDALEGRCLQTIPLGKRPVLALTLSNEPSLLGTVDGRGRAQVFSIPHSADQQPLVLKVPPDRKDGGVGAIFFGSAGYFAVAGPDRAVRIWQL